MDDTGNGRWLTYSELATIRGINRASAVKLVQLSDGGDLPGMTARASSGCWSRMSG
jgi:hypothetical protein